MADPVLPQPSEYDDFQKNYKSQNLIDNSPSHVRRVYDNSPYLVLPNQKFYIKLHCLEPSLVVYIRQLGELYGDPIPVDLTDFGINFYLYNKHNKLEAKGPATLTDPLTGELTYDWQPLYIQEKGIYNFEFEFTHTKLVGGPFEDDSVDDGFENGSSITASFKLPGYDARYEIIVI